MTAFLDKTLLRAHAAPVDFQRDDLRGAPPCPRLSARWIVAADGRLTCCWQADDPSDLGRRERP